jgi:serine phosphatase RsbU (regulator of sigma subunit)
MASFTEITEGIETLPLERFRHVHIKHPEPATTQAEISAAIAKIDVVSDQTESKFPNYGYDSGQIIVQFDFQNNSTQSEWILRLGNPHLKNVKLFRQRAGEYLPLYKTGAELPLASRPWWFRDFWLPVFIAPGESASFILAAESSQWLSLVPELSSVAHANKVRSIEWAAQLFGLGGILFVLLYNLFVYFVTRERVYLFYILASVAVNILVLPSCAGMHAYFFPSYPDFAEKLWHASAIGWVAFMALFAREFLFKTDPNHWIARFLKYSVYASLPLSTVPFFFGIDQHVAVAFNIISGLFQIVLFAACWQSAVVRRYPPAFIFMLAWGAPIITGSIFIGATQGLWPVTNSILYALMISSVWEVIVMATALGYRIVVLQKEREVAQTALMEKARLEGELQAAKVVQEQLLPASYELPGLQISTFFQPAEIAGGDWYGYIHHPEQNLVTFYIGDITGHGITSAVLTGVVCGAVYSAEMRSKQLGHRAPMEQHLQLAAEALDNILLSTAGRSGRMMTMCFLSIDLNTGKSCSLNAGHPWPIIAKISDEKTVCEKIPGGGSLLGSGVHNYGIHHFELQRGDTLFLYTDGLVENQSINGDVVNYRKIRSILSKHMPLSEQMQELEGTIKNLWQGTKLADDVTFLGIRYGG